MELLKQTVDLALAVYCSGRLHFWKSLEILAYKRNSGKNFNIPTARSHSVKTYIISIENIMILTYFIVIEFKILPLLQNTQLYT